MQINNSIRLIKIFLVAIVSLILAGCTVPLSCHIYNNSKVPITITKYISGNEIEKYYAKQGETILLEKWESGKYKLELCKKTYLVDPNAAYIPNVDYVKFTGFGLWGRRNAYLQIERSGLIYLLMKNDKFPLEKFANQPEGFPIKLVEQKISK